MPSIVVQYRCKPDQADENQRRVEAVFAELAERDPGGVRYATLRLEDDTFVHIAQVDDANPLTEMDAFKAFQADLVERCVEGEGPNPRNASLVGAYRFEPAP